MYINNIEQQPLANLSVDISVFLNVIFFIFDSWRCQAGMETDEGLFCQIEQM